MTGTLNSQTPSPHTHPWDEWVYLLEEKVPFQVDDQVFQATPGYLVILPAGAVHTFTITSRQAKFLVWVSNHAAEQYIEALAEAAQEQELIVEQVRVISLKNTTSATSLKLPFIS